VRCTIHRYAIILLERKAMKTFIIADTHFNHAKIIEYEDRPFQDVDEMNYHMIRAWNNAVEPDDRVWHLGDVGFGNKDKLRDIISTLNGVKYLVLGNHDLMIGKNRAWLDIGFEEVYKFPVCIRNFVWLSHRPMYMNRHMPYLNIHGHLHSNTITNPYKTAFVNVSVEVIDYTPVLLESIIPKEAESNFSKLVDDKNFSSDLHI
jgi:calcineurin-like phosphoesterase family protein